MISSVPMMLCANLLFTNPVMMASNVPGNAEIIIEGLNGFLYVPGDAAAIQACLDAHMPAAAAGDFRSVNAEVEVLLREALARRGVKVQASPPIKRGRPAKEPGNG